MTVNNRKYGSSAYTKEKQQVFLGLCEIHAHVCAGKSWCKQYIYIDMNAGPGVVPELDIAGSPLVFLGVARRLDLPYLATFVEQNPLSAAELHERCKNDRAVSVYAGDHEVIVPGVLANLPFLPRALPGMIYHDPNGEPSFDTLASISRMPQAQRLDIVMNVTATGLKRINGLRRLRDRPYQTLIDGIKSINKKYWIVREPVNQWGWTFLIGSNWDGFPAWRNRGFYRIDSPRGNEILTHIAYSEDEKRALYGQQALPFAS